MVFDPLTALSIAAAVIQFVDFTTKLVSKGNELYKSADGVLSTHAEESALSIKLGKLTKALEESIDPLKTRIKPSAAEEALRDVTLDCMTFAHDLADAIDKLKVAGKNRKWKSFRQGLKAVWKEEELSKRAIHLDRLRQQVVLHLLVCMNENAKNMGQTLNTRMDDLQTNLLANVQQCNTTTVQSIHTLAKDMRQLAIKYGEDARNRLDARQKLVDQWLISNAASIDSILIKLHNEQSERKQNLYKKKVMDSLYFERMDYRHNMIDESYKGTLSWIFDHPPAVQQGYSDFPIWLESTEGLYWISGKAGSGKSTLMKSLLHSDCTVKALHTWCGDQRLLLSSYFFWTAGNETQRSLSGLLRSVLYDLLRQEPDMIPTVSPLRWRSYDLDLVQFPAWTDSDLLFSLRTFLQRISPKAKVCLFIDGLDEAAGDEYRHDKILETLKSLSTLSNLKVCASSRPWERFKNAFNGCSQLKLEDLTRKDISDYISCEVMADTKFKALQQHDNVLASVLISEIADKAKGVWLWVVLAVRSLLRGLQNQDTLLDLQYRLRAIPGELEDFFKQMVSRIEPIYRKKALRLLKIALESPSPTLMNISFLEEEDTSFACEKSLEVPSHDEIQQRLKKTAFRVNILCMDLLEIVKLDGVDYVDFLHRSARDFLDDAEGQTILDMTSVDSFDVDFFMCNALLAQIKMTNTQLRNALVNLMYHASQVYKRKPASLFPLLSSLDQALISPVERLNSSDRFEIKFLWGHCSKPSLMLAIQYGLNEYVVDSLKLSPSLIRQKLRRPFLTYALRRDDDVVSKERGSFRDSMPDKSTISLILNLGADPNEKWGDLTVWMVFLNYISKYARFIRSLDEESRKNLIAVTELLIRYGASRVLYSSTSVPNQPSGRTRVRIRTHQVLARESIRAAFGDEEASRLEMLMVWRSYTGLNLWTSIRRSFW